MLHCTREIKVSYRTIPKVKRNEARIDIQEGLKGVLWIVQLRSAVENKLWDLCSIAFNAALAENAMVKETEHSMNVLSHSLGLNARPENMRELE